jgi:hypothetical protein
MCLYVVNGKQILWSHLIHVYEKCQMESGLYIGHKLKLDHVKLNSYTRMNVRLAVQVLSESVTDLLNFFVNLRTMIHLMYTMTLLKQRNFVGFSIAFLTV